MFLFCSVCFVGRCVAAGPYKDMGVVPALWCGMYNLRRKSYVDIALLTALKAEASTSVD